MPETSAIAKALDRASAQSSLQQDGRDSCHRALKEGTDAQALRATAILLRAGEPRPLPPGIRAHGWPDLPKRELELEALERLILDNPDQRSTFMVALISCKAPSDKARFKLFRKLLTSLEGDTALERLTRFIRSSELQTVLINNGLARRRLITIATDMIRLSGPREGDGVSALLRGLGNLYSRVSKAQSAECAALLDMALSQIQGDNFRARTDCALALFGEDFPFKVLEEGWRHPKIPKRQVAIRDRFAADAIAYGCVAQNGSLEQVGHLLALALSNEKSVEDWISRARYNLRSLASSGTNNAELIAMHAALEKLPMSKLIEFDLFQDAPKKAISQLTDLFTDVGLLVLKLESEVKELKSPERIRSIAGQLIKEEVEGQRDLLGKLQKYALQQRSNVASRLLEAMEAAKADAEKFFLLENAIKATVSFLQGKS